MIFNKSVSIYRRFNDSTSIETVMIGKWLYSLQHKDKVDLIRSTTDRQIVKQLKNDIPAITPAGVFYPRRGRDCLTSFSGFMQVDIDHLGNEDLDLEMAKCAIMAMGAVYCGLSLSGKGLWAMFRIPTAEGYGLYYKALCTALEKEGIISDPACKDITRLRAYSYDMKARFNPDGTIWTEKAAAKRYVNDGLPITKAPVTGTEDKVEYCLHELFLGKIDITASYEDWVKVACAFYNEYGEHGRQYFHRAARFHEYYDYDENDRKFDECTKMTGYKIGTFFHLCRQAGIEYSKKVLEVSVDNDIFRRMDAKNNNLSKLVRTMDLRSSTDGKALA